MNLKKFLTISVAAASLAIPMSGQSSLLSSYKSKCIKSSAMNTPRIHYTCTLSITRFMTGLY